MLILAPEIVEEKPYTNKVDCWSIGILLYQMLSFDLPFFSENIDELFEAVKKGEYSLEDEVWEGISEEAIDLIKKLLVTNPE